MANYEGRISAVETEMKNMRKEFDEFRKETKEEFDESRKKLDLLLGDRRILLFLCSFGPFIAPVVIDILKSWMHIK